MARPTKKGLDYFPFDVVFFGDIKIKRLKSRYGTDGICLYLYLLTQIYAEGYYLKVENEEDFYDDINDTLAIDEGKARQIIKYCSERSMIVIITPKEIGSHQVQNIPVQGVKVLTATGIQIRYAEALKKRKKSIAEIKGEYWLLTEKEEAELDTFYKSQPNLNNSENNHDNSAINQDNSAVNELNKTKLNKSITNDIEVSKKESNKKEIKSYDEVFEELKCVKSVKEALLSFIRHLLVNGVTLINERLEDIIISLDFMFGKDEVGKVHYIKDAISKGYIRLPLEEDK